MYGGVAPSPLVFIPRRARSIGQNRRLVPRGVCVDVSLPVRPSGDRRLADRPRLPTGMDGFMHYSLRSFLLCILGLSYVKHFKV